MSTNMNLKTLLPSKLFDILERAGISTPKPLLLMSSPDIKRLTNINSNDICLIKNVAANCCAAPISNGHKLSQIDFQTFKITTGCCAIDSALNGGLRRGELTELYGESGSGKTQFAIYMALHNWSAGTAYICTEVLFPVKRFEQIKKSLPDYNAQVDYGKNIFVEHATESTELLSCVRIRLPKLLAHNKISLVVIDSVAGPFRCESTNYVQRAEDLREFAICLISLAQNYNLAVLCINQVTACLEGGSNNLMPALGLAWANMVSSRLWLKKSLKFFNVNTSEKTPNDDCVSINPLALQIRELSIIFSPHLPNNTAEFVITANGLRSVN